jgi:hypothetical protein
VRGISRCARNDTRRRDRARRTGNVGDGRAPTQTLRRWGGTWVDLFTPPLTSIKTQNARFLSPGRRSTGAAAQTTEEMRLS